jgi:hypothetical protein
MKKGWVLVMVVAGFCGCNNSSPSKQAADSLDKSIDDRFNRVADSAKKNLKNLKDRIEKKIEDRDSSERQD